MKKKLLILGPSPFNTKINHAGGQLTAITNLVKYMNDENISYHIIDTFRSTFPPQSMFRKLLSSLAKYRELKESLRNEAFFGAVVFVSYGFGYWEKMIFSLLIEKKGIKTLFFIRSGHFMESVKKRDYQVPLKKYLMNKLSYIGHQGGDWKPFYLKMGISENKLIKVLNWIEIDNNIYTANEKITFLYVGWMVKEKGVNELVNVILENESLDKFEFIFIGGGTLLDQLQEKIKKKGVTNIKMIGWLDSKDVANYYKTSDVLVLPSYAEGFPNVILEALNHRLPIISTDVGAISESVVPSYNGFLIKPRDKKALLKAILELGNSKKLREKFSSNSEKILIKNHSIKNNCETILQLF